MLSIQNELTLQNELQNLMLIMHLDQRKKHNNKKQKSLPEPGIESGSVHPRITPA